MLTLFTYIYRTLMCQEVIITEIFWIYVTSVLLDMIFISYILFFYGTLSAIRTSNKEAILDKKINLIGLTYKQKTEDLIPEIDEIRKQEEQNDS
mgnify:CR=1 FL=1